MTSPNLMVFRQNLLRLVASPTVIAVVFIGVALPYYSTNNDFRFFYHPDESSKVQQVISGDYNFNHPMLLLTTTRLFTLALGERSELSPQTVAVAGRIASAVFAALAVTALAMLAFNMAGPLAGWTVGFTLLCNPLLYELAHYMKEDAALILGIALCLLALQLYWKRRDFVTLLSVGAACGVAASAKYVGLFMLPFVLPIIVLCSSRSTLGPLARVGAFSFAFTITLLTLNLPVLANPAKLFQSFGVETRVAIEGHLGLTRDLPHLLYIETYVGKIPLIISLLAGIFILGLIVRGRGTTPVEWIIVGFPFVFLTVLSFVPKASVIYFLPVGVLTYFLGGMGAIVLGRAIGRIAPAWRGSIHIAFCALFLCILSFESHAAIVARYDAFGRSDHEKLRAWIERNLPPTAVIAQDARVSLPSADRWEYRDEERLPQKVIASAFVPDLGSMKELKNGGVTHVAIAKSMYKRFFGELRPTSQYNADFLRRRSFYSELRKQGKLIWFSRPGAVGFLQPGIELYEIGTAVPINVTTLAPSK